jgi:hypothetical protein
MGDSAAAREKFHAASGEPELPCTPEQALAE